ncbi:Uncharacterised protein [Bordetella pertussis]|nr:Uncharacterised protein [Bordetella pertussis]
MRRTRVVCSFSSSRPSVRLAAETVSPSCSAAAVIEPVSTTATKACNSSRVVFIVEFKSKEFGSYRA